MADGTLDVLAISPPPRSGGRWEILGGLRFVLAMVVVSGHLAWFAPAGTVLPLATLGGTSAVLGFLLISGFSIAHSLERRPTGFYQRRVLRIYPLYVVALLYSLLPFLSGADALRTGAADIVLSRPHVWTVLGNLLMLQNLVCPPVPSNILVWTLGVEAVCYLFAPWLWKLPTGVLLAAGVFSAATFAVYPRTGWPHYAELLYGLPVLLFAWAWLGGLLLHRYRNGWRYGVCLAIAGAALVAANHQFEPRSSVMTFAAVALLVTFAGRVMVPIRLGRLLTYLGDLSYPLYLFHLPTFVLGYCILEVRGVVTLLVGAVAVSAAFLWIEVVLKPVVARALPRRDVPRRPAALSRGERPM